MPFIPELFSFSPKAWIAKAKAYLKLRHHHIHHKAHEEWAFLGIEGLSDSLHYISTHQVFCQKCKIVYVAKRAWIKNERCATNPSRWAKRPIAEVEAKARTCTQYS